jgi:hypothetical protein
MVSFVRPLRCFMLSEANRFSIARKAPANMGFSLAHDVHDPTIFRSAGAWNPSPVKPDHSRRAFIPRPWNQFMNKAYH